MRGDSMGWAAVFDIGGTAVLTSRGLHVSVNGQQCTPRFVMQNFRKIDWFTAIPLQSLVNAISRMFLKARMRILQTFHLFVSTRA